MNESISLIRRRDPFGSKFIKDHRVLRNEKCCPVPSFILGAPITTLRKDCVGGLVSGVGNNEFTQDDRLSSPLLHSI